MITTQQEEYSKEQLSDNDIFLKKLFNKHIVSSIISMFGAQCCVIINSVLAGNFFHAEGLAVMSVASPFYSLFAAVGALTGVGGATLTSHFLGRDNTQGADASFTLSVMLSAGLSAVISLVCLLFLEPMLYMLGSSPQIYEAAHSYSVIYLLGGFGTAMFYLPYNFFKLVGKLQLLTTMFLGMAVANLILDIVFVKFFGMGIDGIALGTVLSSIGVSLLGIKCLVQGENSFNLVRVSNLKISVDLMKLGTPSALNQLLTFFRLLLMNRIIVAIAGDMGLAAFSVFSALEKLSLVVLSGLAQSTSSFIGVFSKEMDTVSVRRIEKRAHIIGMALILPMMAAIMMFPTEICQLFGIHGADKLPVAADAAYIFAWSLPPSVCCFLMFFYFQSAGFTGLANILIFFRSFLFLVVPAYLLAPVYGLNAVWASMTIASLSPLLFMLVAIPAYYRKGYRGIFLQNMRAETNGRYISFAIKADVMEIVENVDKIADFCRKNDLTKKETMLVRLSMEEMMISITEHCFEPDSGEMLDVRVLVIKNKDDVMIVLRIRNGGKLFNPIDYYQRLSEDDPYMLGDALGIAMIVKAADAIHYKTTFGVNNLTVIIDRKNIAK